MADVYVNALTQISTEPTTTDSLVAVNRNTNEGKIIDYNKLADVILNKLTSKTYSGLNTTSKLLVGAINELDSDASSLNSRITTKVNTGIILKSVGTTGTATTVTVSVSAATATETIIFISQYGIFVIRKSSNANFTVHNLAGTTISLITTSATSCSFTANTWTRYVCICVSTTDTSADDITFEVS